MNSSPDLNWMVGKILASVQKVDVSWVFRLDDGTVVLTESTWRLVAQGRLFVSSEDDGHQFGLPCPVSAVERVESVVGSSAIRRVDVRPNTSDLILEFDDSKYIEFLCVSSGYESWRVDGRTSEVICMGGGTLAMRPSQRS